MLLPLIIASLIAFATNLVLTPLILKFAHKKNWVDQPNHRSVHKDPVPRLGGFGIFSSFFVALVFLFVWDQVAGGSVLPAVAKSVPSILILLGLVSTFVLGLMDDFYQFRAIYKLLLQLFGAFMAIGAGLIITEITIPFTTVVIELGPFGPFLTLLWIIGITNAVNLIDGMDGLAGGFAIIAFSVFGLAMALTDHWFAAAGCFMTVGATLAFLVFNFPPAKTFMGDTGSLTLGYLLAILALWGGPGESLFHKFWLLPFTVALIPVGDTTSAVLRRLRQGVPIWSPDKEHTHHKLLRLGLSTKQVLAVMLAVVVVTSSPVLLSAIQSQTESATPLAILSSFVSVIVVVILFTVLHVTYRKRFPDQEKEQSAPLPPAE